MDCDCPKPHVAIIRQAPAIIINFNGLIDKSLEAISYVTEAQAARGSLSSIGLNQAPRIAIYGTASGMATTFR